MGNPKRGPSLVSIHGIEPLLDSGETRRMAIAGSGVLESVLDLRQARRQLTLGLGDRFFDIAEQAPLWAKSCDAERRSSP